LSTTIISMIIIFLYQYWYCLADCTLQAAEMFVPRVASVVAAAAYGVLKSSAQLKH
jgi:hypothetical protein